MSHAIIKYTPKTETKPIPTAQPVRREKRERTSDLDGVQYAAYESTVAAVQAVEYAQREHMPPVVIEALEAAERAARIAQAQVDHYMAWKAGDEAGMQRAEAILDGRTPESAPSTFFGALFR